MKISERINVPLAIWVLLVGSLVLGLWLGDGGLPLLSVFTGWVLASLSRRAFKAGGVCKRHCILFGIASVVLLGYALFLIGYLSGILALLFVTAAVLGLSPQERRQLKWGHLQGD